MNCVVCGLNSEGTSRLLRGEAPQGQFGEREQGVGCDLLVLRARAESYLHRGRGV